LKKEFGEKIILGAGTVRNVSQLEQVIEAGAEFSIAPNLDLESVELSIRKDFLHLPGVFTATEI
jgi:2-dehydro-3-deoxyphosphogluconate aldolase/(4S)-4-hydroxy-2-oxoglutarate aldolase